MNTTTKSALNPYCHLMVNSWIQGDFGISDYKYLYVNGERSDSLVADECWNRRIVRDDITDSYLPSDLNRLVIEFGPTKNMIGVGNDYGLVFQVSFGVKDDDIWMNMNHLYESAKDAEVGLRVIKMAQKLADMLLRMERGTFAGEEELASAMRWLEARA